MCCGEITECVTATVSGACLDAGETKTSAIRNGQESGEPCFTNSVQSLAPDFVLIHKGHSLSNFTTLIQKASGPLRT